MKDQGSISKFEALLAFLKRVDPLERREFVRRYNDLRPDEQVQAMLIAGPEGEEWGRMFEDLKNGGQS